MTIPCVQVLLLHAARHRKFFPIVARLQNGCNVVTRCQLRCRLPLRRGAPFVPACRRRLPPPLLRPERLVALLEHRVQVASWPSVLPFQLDACREGASRSSRVGMGGGAGGTACTRRHVAITAQPEASLLAPLFCVSCSARLSCSTPAHATPSHLTVALPAPPRPHSPTLHPTHHSHPSAARAATAARWLAARSCFTPPTHPAPSHQAPT